MKNKAFVASLCIILVMVSFILAMRSAARSTTAQTILSSNGTIANPQQPYSYIVYTDGQGGYFAKNRKTGQISSGANASTVFDNTIGNLTNGGSIFVAPGTYSITHMITLNKNNIILCGTGEATILTTAINNKMLYVSNPEIDYVRNVTIKDLNLIGSGAANTNNYLIYFAYVSNCAVENCYLSNSGAGAIFAVDTEYSTFTQNQLENNSFNGIGLAQGSFYNTISENFVNNTGTYNGIDLNGVAAPTSNNLVIGNVVTYSTQDGICTDTASGNTIQSNILAYNKIGIDISGVNGSTDNRILGNQIEYGTGANDTSHGIQVCPLSDRTLCIGNTVSMFSDGSCITWESNNGTVQNNVCNDSNVAIELCHNNCTQVSNNQLLNCTVGIKVWSRATANSLFVNSFINCIDTIQDFGINTVSFGNLANGVPMANNVPLSLPTANLQAVGTQITVTVGQRVSAGDLLFLNNTGYFRASATSNATMPVCALATQNANAGASSVILLQGYFENAAWSWSPTNPLYASTNTGAMTQSYPSSSGNIVQTVGYPYSATIVYFDPTPLSWLAFQ